MYANGAKEYFDAIRTTPTISTFPFSQSGLSLRGALRYYREMRATMGLDGDEELKVGSASSAYRRRTSTERWSTRHTKPIHRGLAGFLADCQRRRKTRRARIHLYDPRLPDRRPERAIQLRVFQTDWTPKLAAYIIAQYAGGLVEPPPEGPIARSSMRPLRWPARSLTRRSA